MLPISEFDGLKPYEMPLAFQEKHVPGGTGIEVLRDSILQKLPGHKNAVILVDEKWNESLGAYADKLREYVEEVDMVVEVEAALEKLCEEVRAKTMTLQEMKMKVEQDSKMKKYYKKVATEWAQVCKQKYAVRYQPKAWLAARIIEEENYTQATDRMNEWLGPARWYVEQVDLAYASLMRKAVSVTKHAARARGGVMQGAVRTGVAENISSTEEGNSGATLTGSTSNATNSDATAQQPRARLPDGPRPTLSHSDPTRPTQRRRPRDATERHDRPTRSALFLQRASNLDKCRDTTLPYEKRIRACTALLQALPAAITKIAPTAVRECSNMEPETLRHYLEEVQRALDSNSDLAPVWYHIFFQKMPSTLQTAIHRHFAPVPMSLVPFEEVEAHVRHTYLSTEILVTVLQKLRTEIRFDPRVKGSAAKFATAVRLARDRLRTQFGEAINDTTMFSYINDWLGSGNWMAREFNKYLLGKTLTWDNINQALVYCCQHNTLYEVEPRDRNSANPVRQRDSARPFPPRYSPYPPTQRYNAYSPTQKPSRNSALQQLQASVNQLMTRFDASTPIVSQGSVNPNQSQQAGPSHVQPSTNNINTHAVPPPPNYRPGWTEKYCSFCKFVGKPDSVVRNHNTKECREVNDPRNSEQKTAWASRMARMHPDNPTNPHNRNTRRPGLGSNK